MSLFKVQNQCFCLLCLLSITIYLKVSRLSLSISSKNEKLTKVAEKFVPPTALSKLKIFQLKKYFYLDIG